MKGYGVLMSVYAKENAAWLTAAVESMLHQTIPPEEFVLVCDGPLTEELNAVIETFCRKSPNLFQIVRLAENQGLGPALNAGLAQCRSELIARMDADDLALPDRMERQLEVLEKHPEISVLGGQIIEFDEDPQNLTVCRRVPCERDKIRRHLKYRSPMNHNTVVLRKSHVLQAGGYQSLSGCEDYLLWAQMAHLGFWMENIPAVCCLMRAGRNMYARRGGVRYFCNMVKLERILLKRTTITLGEFCGNVAVRFVGEVLVPASARQTVFRALLREPVEPARLPYAARKRVQL